jgi:hypothetical protein
MNSSRRQDLIEVHRDLRKVAFEAVYSDVDAYFRDAEEALSGIKVASELVDFDPVLLKHFSEK